MSQRKIMKRLLLVAALLLASACVSPSNAPSASPPSAASPAAVPLSGEEVVSTLIGKMFSGDLRGASELLLTPPNVSPSEFWKSRFDSFSMAVRNQTAGLSSCTVNGSSDDMDTAQRVEALGYHVQEARLVVLNCTPSPGLAAPPGVSRVVKINDTWKIVTAISINTGRELLRLPGGRLGLEVSNVTNRSFVLGVHFDKGVVVNLTDLSILVDGKEIRDIERFKGGNLSFGETVSIDIRPMALHSGSQLRFLHRPSNKTAEFVVNPQ